MGLFLLALACLISIAPAAVAIISGNGVPPQQGVLFGCTELTLAALAAGLAYQNRYNIWLQPAARLTRLLCIAGSLAAASLVAYLFVYNLCVIEHPLYKDKLLFPLWTSGKLAAMVGTAGSRYGAVDAYGLAAVFDAISEMPGSSYAVSLGTLLLLYAPAIATACALAFILALRYPTHLFRPAAAPGEAFDVFLCHNTADKLIIRAIAKELASRQIRVFLDENENPPGQLWTDHVSTAISTAPSFAIFFGAAGIGNWQKKEMEAIIYEQVKRGCNVVPAFLPDAPPSGEPPMLLRGITWVDFRLQNPDPMAQLIRGIRTLPAAPNGAPA